MAEGDTCDVCGGTETKLVDGFYYCAECGTQDTNVRETIVEHTALADGTFAYFSKTKYSVKIKDGVQMSAEWYKWHAYNFVMAGLTERLLKLGAEPTFKMKVLWIWAKYIKKYQNKKEMGLTEAVSGINDKTIDTEHSGKENDEVDTNDKPQPTMTLKLLICILYLALNLDRSSIQLSHFRRYIKDGRLGIHRSMEFVPKEIDRSTRALKGLWFHFSITFTPTAMPSTMRRFSDLDLGPFLVPDLEGMIDNHLQELCLPKSLKSLVMSLMDLAPINFLAKDKYAKKSQVVPDSECVVMSYVLVALKMCFGLDDDYEIRLSDAVDEINREENHLKAYKSDMYHEPSERLFSFREWSKYLLFKKYMLCKHYLPMARERNLFLDDYVYMEHSKRGTKKEVHLSDEITMDIIKKIPEHNDFGVIPLSEFEPSATPLSDHTDVISRHLRDPEKRQILCEDFTQYSINYACQDLALPSYSEETSENIIVGVSKSGKTLNNLIGLHLLSVFSDSTMVYVKNCENKNWFKTKRPTAEHIVKVKEDSDHEYDSNIENSPVDNSCNSNIMQKETIQDAENTFNSIDNEDKKLDIFEEEEESRNIFDDDFLDIDTNDTKLVDTIQNFDNDYSETMETLRYEDSYFENDDIEDSKVNDMGESLIDLEIDAKPTFDPETFNREETIKELMLAACREYKVPVPHKFKPRERKKRKLDPNVEDGATNTKKAKLDDASKKVSIEKKAQVNEIVAAYYRSLQQDLLHEVSQHVRTFVENVEQHNPINDSIDQNSVIENENDSIRGINASIDQNTFIENENDSVVEINNNMDQNHESNLDQAALAGSKKDLDENEGDGNKSDDESILDPVYKGDPKFDEKTHDTEQLYLKIKGELGPQNLFESDNDEEINKLIEEKVKQSCENSADDFNSDDDPLDDLPLSYLKQKKQKSKRENLIQNTEKIDKFNYWFRHYITQFLNKGDGVTKAFHADMKDTFPRSFVFVLTECAAILNCTTCILYKYLTEIEEKILQKDGYVKKMRSFKGTGLRMERRDGALRYAKQKMQKRKKQSRP